MWLPAAWTFPHVFARPNQLTILPLFGGGLCTSHRPDRPGRDGEGAAITILDPREPTAVGEASKQHTKAKVTVASVAVPAADLLGKTVWSVRERRCWKALRTDQTSMSFKGVVPGHG
jgi:hypothetical protein